MITLEERPPTRAVEASTKRRRRPVSTLATRPLLFVVLALGAFLSLLPLLWMLGTSLKRDRDIFAFPPKWIPDPATLLQYGRVFSGTPILQWFANTALITGTSVVGATLSSSLVAYGFARLRAPGATGLFYLMLSTLMLPGIVLLIPQFIEFSYLGWIDTFYPLIIPHFFGVPFYIFMLRQFFLTLPRDLDDAALIDGVGYIGIWWRILLPLSKPAHATVAVFQFIASWNDFMGPYVYLNSSSKMTLALGTRYFLGIHGAQWGQLMAMSCLMFVPMLVAFAFGQRYFMEGISVTGMGGR